MKGAAVTVERSGCSTLAGDLFFPSHVDQPLCVNQPVELQKCSRCSFDRRWCHFNYLLIAAFYCEYFMTVILLSVDEENLDPIII